MTSRKLNESHLYKVIERFKAFLLVQKAKYPLPNATEKASVLTPALKSNVVVNSFLTQIEVNINNVMGMLSQYDNYYVPYLIESVYGGLGKLWNLKSSADEIVNSLDTFITVDKKAFRKELDALVSALMKGGAKFREVCPALTESSWEQKLIVPLTEVLEIDLNDPKVKQRLASELPDEKAPNSGDAYINSKHELRVKAVSQAYKNFANVAAKNINPAEQAQFTRDLLQMVSDVYLFLMAEFAVMPTTTVELMPFLNPKALETTVFRKLLKLDLKLDKGDSDANYNYTYALKDGKKENFNFDQYLADKITDQKTKMARNFVRVFHYKALTFNQDAELSKVYFQALNKIDNTRKSRIAITEALIKHSQAIDSALMANDFSDINCADYISQAKSLIDKHKQLDQGLTHLCRDLREEKSAELESATVRQHLVALASLEQDELVRESEHRTYKKYKKQIGKLEGHLPKIEIPPSPPENPLPDHIPENHESVNHHSDQRYEFSWDEEYGSSQSSSSNHDQGIHEHEIEEKEVQGQDVQEQGVEKLAEEPADRESKEESIIVPQITPEPIHNETPPQTPSEPSVKVSLSLPAYNESPTKPLINQPIERRMSNSTASLMTQVMDNPEEKACDAKARTEESALAKQLFDLVEGFRATQAELSTWYSRVLGRWPFKTTLSMKANDWFKDIKPAEGPADRLRKMTIISNQIAAYEKSNFIVKFFKNFFNTYTYKKEWLAYQHYQKIIALLPNTSAISSRKINSTSTKLVATLEKELTAEFFAGISLLPKVPTLQEKIFNFFFDWKAKTPIEAVSQNADDNQPSSCVWKISDIKTLAYFRGFFANETLSVIDMVKASENILKNYYATGMNELSTPKGKSIKILMNTLIEKLKLLTKLQDKPYFEVMRNSNSLQLYCIPGSTDAALLRGQLRLDHLYDLTQKENIFAGPSPRQREGLKEFSVQLPCDQDDVTIYTNSNQYFADNKLEIGKAYSDGDCFFDALAQSMENLGIQIPGDVFKPGHKRLRELCKAYLKPIKGEKLPAWIVEALKDESDGIDCYRTGGGYTADELAQMAVSDPIFKNWIAIWGRPMVEGRMICDALAKVGIKLSIMAVEAQFTENMETKDGKKVRLHTIVPNLVDATGIKQSELKVDENTATILIAKSHFVPLLRNASLKPMASLQTQPAQEEEKRHTKALSQS